MPLITCKPHLVTLHLQTLKKHLVALTLNLTCHKGIRVRLPRDQIFHGFFPACVNVSLCFLDDVGSWM